MKQLVIANTNDTSQHAITSSTGRLAAIIWFGVHDHGATNDRSVPILHINQVDVQQCELSDTCGVSGDVAQIAGMSRHVIRKAMMMCVIWIEMRASICKVIITVIRTWSWHVGIDRRVKIIAILMDMKTMN